MKMKPIAVCLALCIAGSLMGLAQDMNMGTGSWKLNEAKSKFSPGSPKGTMVVYEPAGDSVKVTIDGTGFDGKPSHTEWTGMFDGKDYPITGDSNQSTRSYTKAGDGTMKVVVKNGGKVVLTASAVISADGKSRTVKASGTKTDGKKFTYTAVYDRQ